MERFTLKQINKILKLKEKICCKNDCKNFNNINPCDCFKKFVYLKELIYSKIPKDYWLLTLKQLTINPFYKTIIRKYVKNIDNAIENGLGIIYCGPKRGIGKTSSACIIGKECIKRNYNVFYTIAQKIIEGRFNDNYDLFLEKIYKADLLIIDELDKIIMKSESNVPKMLENLLREILPNKKSIIICTNFTEKEVENKFGIISLLKRYMKIVAMDGKDYSDELVKKWDERLLKKDRINYDDETLVKDSKIYWGFKNEKR